MAITAKEPGMRRAIIPFAILSALGFIIDPAAAQIEQPKVLRRFEPSGIGHGGALRHIAFSGDAKVLAIAADPPDNCIAVWDLSGGKILFREPMFKAGTSAIALSDDGKMLAAVYCVSGRGFSNETTLIVWDVATKKERAQIPLGDRQGNMGTAIAFAKDGKVLAIRDKEITLIDLVASKVRLKIAEDMAYGIEFHPSGKLFATAGKAIRFWNPQTGKQRGEISDATNIRFSRDGTKVAYRGERKILVRHAR